jgi:hypothetical protein
LSGIDFTRLRRGEIVAGAGGVLLFVFMFVPSWYSLNSTYSGTYAALSHMTSWNGWWGLGGLRYLVLVTILAAVALAYFQAAERAPAIPVALAVIVTVLGGLTVLGSIYRLLAGPPSGGSYLNTQAGPWLGLLASLVIAYGGYASLREEGGADPAALDIETVRLGMSSRPPGS